MRLFVATLLTFGAAQFAWAQDSGIAVERFAPAIGPGAFGQVEAAVIPPPAQVWIGGALLGVGRPLVLRSRFTGDEVAVPVRYRLTVDLGAEVGVWRKRLSLGIGLPLSVYQSGDRLQISGSTHRDAQDIGASLQMVALGDIRLRAKARLLPVDAKAGLAMVFELTVPGGGQHDFVATSSVTAAPHLVGSFRHRFLAGALNLAVRFMPERQLYQTILHNQLEWGGALGAVLPVRRVGLAFYGETVGFLNLVSSGYERGIELRGAMRLGWWNGSLDLGGGGGFGPLAPGWRAFLLVRAFFGRSGVPGCIANPVTL